MPFFSVESGTQHQDRITSVGNMALSDRTESKPVIKNCDIADDMRDRAIELIQSSPMLVERDIAMKIKKSFDEEFGPKWHCVVGRHFASHVTYEPRHYIYVLHGNRVFLIFKAGGK